MKVSGENYPLNQPWFFYFLVREQNLSHLGIKEVNSSKVSKTTGNKETKNLILFLPGLKWMHRSNFFSYLIDLSHAPGIAVCGTSQLLKTGNKSI